MSFEVPAFEEDEDVEFEDAEMDPLTRGSDDVMALMQNELDAAAGADAVVVKLKKSKAISATNEMQAEAEAAYAEIEKKLEEDGVELPADQEEDDAKEDEEAPAVVKKPSKAAERQKVDMEKVYRGEVFPLCFVCEQRHDFGECPKGGY